MMGHIAIIHSVSISLSIYVVRSPSLASGPDCRPGDARAHWLRAEPGSRGWKSGTWGGRSLEMRLLLSGGADHPPRQLGKTGPRFRNSPGLSVLF